MDKSWEIRRIIPIFRIFASNGSIFLRSSIFIPLIPMDIVRIADVFAIPAFLALLLYFLAKPEKTFIEWGFLVFALIGLILDSYFTYDFLFST